MRGKLDNNDNENYFFNSDLGGGGKNKYPTPPFDPDDDPDFDPDFDNDEVSGEACWMFDTISALVAMDKPFGMLFDMPKIEKFLKARGYFIHDKYFSHINDSIKIAIKSDDPDTVPDTQEGSKLHVRAVFAEEVQEIILKWLLKIGK